MIDSHIHFDDRRFDADREEVYRRAIEAGVSGMIVPGVTEKSWLRTKSVSNQYPNTFPAYGLHPYFIDQHSEQDLSDLRQWIEKENPIGVGECGLDYFLKDLDREKQKYFFIAQLKLAKEFELPVIVHARKAVEDVILLIKESGLSNGMIHSFNGSFQQAKRLIELGFYLSFGGAITSPKANQLHRLIMELPLESMLIETDAPDQPDHTHQGERNEPAYLINVLNFICEKRREDRKLVLDQFEKNIKNLFSLEMGTE